MHLLAIDCGNSRLKWGIHDGVEWLSTGAVSISEASKPGYLRARWAEKNIRQVIVSNVAGRSMAAVIASAVEPSPLRFIQSKVSQCGVSNGYLVAEQLGSDRWAALIGARVMATAKPAIPQLVIMAGTALTVDALTPEGKFIGGLILPGPTLMRASLNKGTDGLPADVGDYETFPKSTLNAISTWAIEACPGAISRIPPHLQAYSGVRPDCILGGGAASSLVPHLQALSFSPVFNENLVLDGLHAIAVDMNQDRVD